ncbi:MAG: phosphoribosylamine--glycine ligase [Balneolaceae bacterium]
MGQTNVLLIGSGGREHTLAWKISQSGLLKNLYIAPGNPGTSSCGQNVDLDTDDFDEVTEFVRQNEIDLVVVGPEKPLVDGMADHLEDREISVFGPRKAAALLEGSKDFAKSFMREYNIPTAEYQSFNSGDFDKAFSYIKNRNRFPIVLKADGLAGGKGVFICQDEEEVESRLNQFREDRTLQDAADKLIIEEFMEGEEVSVFIISDGFTAKVLHNAQDHKRIGEGDTGLNTGGMGAYCPAPVMTPELMERVEKEIVLPTITGMQLNDTPYKGILYLGLMITEQGPKVVEYNCRFGDPECQAILPSLKNDLLQLMLTVQDQKLDEIEIELDNLYRCCVVMASGGYPVSYEKGKVISGLDSIDDNALIFHAGTEDKNGEIVTSGGRVLSVVGSGATLREAIYHTYKNIEYLSFEKSYYRTDIGAKGLYRLNENDVG